MLELIKKLRMLFILIALIISTFITQIFSSCKKSTCSIDESLKMADKFEIHMQYHYKNTYVYLTIDEKSIFFPYDFPL